MTNTLKKVLGVVLALAMLLVPMTTLAEDNYGYGDALAVGTATYALDTAYPYTVLTFDPTEEGIYTLTAADGVMGIASYNGMWVTVELSAETVNETTIEWECTSVGQSLWIAVAGEGDSVSIELTRRDRNTAPELPWTVYENLVAPTPFTFDGEEDNMMYVDTLDDVEDDGFLGEDGYYHYGSEDGPVLYVKLTDELMNIADMIGYGQMRAAFTDENGDIVSKTDYNEAAAEYVACADPRTGFYPLTDDLIEMYVIVGLAQYWYGEDGFVGGELADAWMFACYYDETALDNGTTTPGGDEDDDDNTVTTTTTTEPADDVTTTTTVPVKSPATGDSTNTFVFVTVALLAAGVMMTAVVTKKVNG